jgi:hypothetical protein
MILAGRGLKISPCELTYADNIESQVTHLGKIKSPLVAIPLLRVVCGTEKIRPGIREFALLLREMQKAKTPAA